MNSLFPANVFTPPKILFRKGSVVELLKEAAEFGPRGILVHGASFERSGVREKVLETSAAAQLRLDFFCRSAAEPTLEEISAIIQKGRFLKADWIAGIGGGSVLDLAKAAAGLFHAKEAPGYYQEGGALAEKGIPWIAVPTTAGSGSEATLNSVIINPEKKVKLSIRHTNFLAAKVILDPELLRGAPFQVLCHSGMDALVQAYESFISKNSTWFSENYALKAIQLINRHIVPALTNGKDEDLEAMMLGSFLSGLAFSHSRLGVIHGIAHPLGVLYGLPHGLICSVCFAPSIKLNLPVIRQKYDIMSRAVGMDFLVRITELVTTLKIVSPFKGKPVLEKETIVSETLRSGSTAANPKTVTREDVEFLLREIF
ncbi:MAG TPA: iron-containing alcohol dehydrogenase [Candidatus Omnitrophota bacterium]|nr:iron-containing alcohol dehydrogenase [Candidatus Omnitrophota bacterium]HPS36277.1 iron-containing alcohol dehydrogenase [Candidatus Omnitrophota bacterium]